MDDDTRRRFHIEAGAIRRPYTDAVRLLLLTGVRRDMVLGMRRSELEDIGGREPRWAIPGGFAGRSKSGRPHVVPLSPQALAVIEPRLEDIVAWGRWLDRLKTDDPQPARVVPIRRRVLSMSPD